MTWLKIVQLIQGLYYCVTGIWPVVHMPSFESVTGPKEDKWLVKTVGILVLVIGLALLLSNNLNPSGAEIFLGMGSAVALTFIDTYYVARKIISPIYLLDALAEIILIIFYYLALNH